MKKSLNLILILIFSIIMITNCSKSINQGIDFDSIKRRTAKINNISIEELYTKWKNAKNNKKEIIILDVRSIEEFDNMELKDWNTKGGHIKGALFQNYKNIIDRLNNKIKEKTVIDNLKKDQRIYLICTLGVRSLWAYEEMAKHGFTNIYNVAEGMHGWNKRKYPLEYGLAKSFIEKAKKDYDNLLKTHVKNGLLDYPKFRNKHFYNYLKYVQRNIHLKKLNKNDRLAFYINAYNAIVIKMVLDDYNEIKNSHKGVRTISNFFNRKKYSVAGTKMSLNHLENNVIKREFNNYKTHFALVCGAKGCPILLSTSYKGENINEVLNNNIKNYLNSSYGLKIDKKNKVISLSRIFNWFKNDFILDNAYKPAFTGEFAGLKQFIHKYKKDEASDLLVYDIKFLNYDWSLNTK